MKKLLMTLLALVLCLGCCAASAQSGIPDEYMGYWDLTSMNFMGIEMSDEALGEGGFALIHTDGMLIFSIDGEQVFTAPLQYKDGVCVMDTLEGELPVAIDDAGLLSFAMEADGMSIKLGYTRGAVPELDARIVPFVGEWRMAYAEIMGITMTEEELGECTAVIYENGYGSIALDGDFMVFAVKADENGVSWVDDQGQADPMLINEKGQVCFSLDVDGIPLTLVMDPVNAAAAEPVETPVAVPTDALTQSYDGVWKVVRVGMMGIEFTPEALEMGEITLEISGETARMSVDGEAVECALRYEADGAVINDGAIDIPLVVDENGAMTMKLEMDGLSMDLMLERECDAPAVTPAAPQAQAAGYDGMWKASTMEVANISVDPSLLGMGDISLEINGGAAILSFGEISGECTVRYEADGVVVNDGFTDMPIALQENGQLKATIEIDGMLVVLFMDRVGGNPEAPAAPESPAAQMAECSICGKMHDAGKSETFGDLVLCPDCYTAYFN